MKLLLSERHLSFACAVGRRSSSFKPEETATSRRRTSSYVGHATSYVHTMSYTIWTYDIVCHVHTTLYIHFRHTTLYTICGGEHVLCRMWHVRCRMLTYDIVFDVQCSTYDVVRLHPVHRTYDMVHAMFNTMSYVARTMSYVHDVWHRTWRTTS
jgi:hypothetical protein